VNQPKPSAQGRRTINGSDLHEYERMMVRAAIGKGDSKLKGRASAKLAVDEILTSFDKPSVSERSVRPHVRGFGAPQGC
jgi:hypothetical protein